MSFSILILTLNEEDNLSKCLESISWCDDVVVLDSYSKDGTVDVARAAGVRVYQRKFDDFAGQRNFALDEIDFKHPWVFQLDADEIFTPKLREACEREIAKDEFSGYLVPSKLMFRGRWLRFSGTYPIFQTRLVKVGEIRFVQAGHGQREGESERGLGTIREPYLHYNFSKGVEDWFARHNKYSSQEARETLRLQGSEPINWGDLFKGDRYRRRRSLKRIAMHVPARPIVRFVYLYLFKGGFLDGIPGFHYCVMLMVYDYLTGLKLTELREKNEPPETATDAST